MSDEKRSAVNVEDLAARVKNIERVLAEHHAALQEHGHFRPEVAEEKAEPAGAQAGAETSGNKPAASRRKR